MMKVVVDPNSGFCGGVAKAIRRAEKEVEDNNPLYCLGEIVHNPSEIERLADKGVKFIDHETFKNIQDARVLIRAHGEPPETYLIAEKNNLKLIDATCKVVQRLQNKVKAASEEMQKENGQIVIFGRPEHPEIIGLRGQSLISPVIIENKNDLDKIDFSKPVRLFSQTTRSLSEFEKISELIEEKLKQNQSGQKISFKVTNSVCRQVSNREKNLGLFAQKHDVVVFVGGRNSSNAKFLFGICLQNNSRSYFVSEGLEVENSWFDGAKTVGITGATSTPRWLLNEIADKIKGMQACI